MKKIKLSRKAIIISIISVAMLVAFDITLIAVGFFVTGRNMARFESRPLVGMQVSVNDAIANVRVINHSDDEYRFGTQFTLYRRFGWRWRRVFFENELTEGVPWRSIAFIAYPNAYADRWTIDLHQYFGALPSGEYRIVKSIGNSASGAEIRVADGFVLAAY